MSQRSLNPSGLPVPRAPRRLLAVAATLVAAVGLLPSGAEAATPAPTTREDFTLPGTQPLTITDNLALPAVCGVCHSNFGSPTVEPMRNWQGSMVAQSGRDPITYAAMAIANQDAPHAGDLCIRCHMPKAWLEGRSSPEDASATTADDRQGVQCNVCHRLVDPAANPGAPAEDAAILAGLTAPVVTVGAGQMVIDPEDRLRGPFDVVAELGSDPHASARETLVSPFHRSSALCGTCHEVRNPVFQRNMLGQYELSAMDTPGDPALAFPEQQTYTEWENSDYATTGVDAPQFAYNGQAPAGEESVSSCQDCHMPKVSGKCASQGTQRTDLPLHELVGANTFVPTIIPLHPVFGAEVNATILAEGAAKSLRMLRRAATVRATLDAGNLTVHVVNETGHKLPTGYPDGRRMWLSVRAWDAAGAVVFESGKYVFETADLVDDANLHVWETHQGISSDVAMATGQAAGPGFHLALNNVREFDNRIPPRGFTNAAYEAVDAQPIGQAYADGQYWDDVTYPVGTGAAKVDVILYYQTTSKEYVEFLRDENITNEDGSLLYQLWTEADMGPPVEMAHVVVDTDAKTVGGCRKNVEKLQAKYLKTYLRAWGDCFADSAAGLACDDAAVASAVSDGRYKVRSKLGSSFDKKCAGKGLTPGSLGLGSYCPSPCASIVLFDMTDVADCSICLTENLANTTLVSAYGTTPPAKPATVPFGAAGDCEANLGSAAVKLASAWSSTLLKCEGANASGKNDPALDCSTDPSGKITKAKEKSSALVDLCTSFDGIEGCAAGAANNAAAYQCIEDAISGAVADYPSVPYP